jgi:hypothetical protein
MSDDESRDIKHGWRREVPEPVSTEPAPKTMCVWCLEEGATYQWGTLDICTSCLYAKLGYA